MSPRDQVPEPLFFPWWSYAIDIEFYLRLLGLRLAVLDREVVSSFRVSPNQLSAVLGKSQLREHSLLFEDTRRRHPFNVAPGDGLMGIGWTYTRLRRRSVRATT